MAPFIFQVYAGVGPPFPETAVKVTGLPRQKGFVSVLMVTLAGIAAFTIIVTGGEVAGFPLAHKALEVTTHVTTCPFTGV
jgi:hypothetical protein